MSIICGEGHTFEITDSCGNTLFQIPQNLVCRYRYNNVIDEFGEAFVDLGDKSGLFDEICLGRHYLKIDCDGLDEWFGPITRVESCPMRISAKTPLWWTTRRVATEETSNEAYANPIEMFEDVVLYHTNNPDMGDVFNSCDGVDECDPDFSPLCYSQTYRLPGGEEAIGPNEDNRQLFGSVATILEDYADSFLDYTEIGTELLYGYHQVPIPAHRASRPTLTKEDWCEKPNIVRDLEDFTTDVFVSTGDVELGSQPFYQNGYYRERVCCTKFGVHQRVEVTNSLNGLNEVQDAAINQLPSECNNSAITFIENLTGTELDPGVNWRLHTMVPGTLVDVNYVDQAEGIYINDTFMLIERIIEGAPGTESVRISLGPVE